MCQFHILEFHPTTSNPNQPKPAFETPNPNAFEIFWRRKWPGPMGLPGRQEISFNLHRQGLLNLATGARSKITIFLGHGTKSKGTILWPTFGARKVAQPCLLMRQLGSWVSPINVWARQKQIVRVANIRWHLQVNEKNDKKVWSAPPKAWRQTPCRCHVEPCRHVEALTLRRNPRHTAPAAPVIRLYMSRRDRPHLWQNQCECQ